MNNGYIKLHRKFLQWEWYNNVNDRLVFIHCLLKANWEDGWFEGVKIPRGSFATSYNNLAKEIGISVQQLRTSLYHLKSTNNLTHTTNYQFSIISINNYDKYQAINTEDNKRLTNEQQTINNNIRRIRKKEINNNMNIIINNWDENVQCDEIAKTTNKRCFRRSSYNINGKNYCNQHSRNILDKILCIKENNELPSWFDKDFTKEDKNINELEEVLKEFI